MSDLKFTLFDVTSFLPGNLPGFKKNPDTEPWHIQNLRHMQNFGIFKTVTYSKPEAYSEPCKISAMERFTKIVNGYNQFHDFTKSAFHILYFMK